jgi:hypothetical protein
MDVKKILKTHMNHIVGCFFANVNGDETKIMDEMYKLIENDIDINFDSKHFYFLKYELIESSKLLFNIDLNTTPKELLKMIVNLIELQRMEQNIKNKAFLIHFRGFKGKVYLEDKENTLRIEAFLMLHNYLRTPFTTIRIFLVKKLLEIKNRLKDDTIEENDYISCKIQEYRIMAILRAIEKHTTLLT